MEEPEQSEGQVQRVRVTVDLDPDERKHLRRLAEVTGLIEPQVLRLALGLDPHPKPEERPGRPILGHGAALKTVPQEFIAPAEGWLSQRGFILTRSLEGVRPLPPGGPAGGQVLQILVEPTQLPEVCRVGLFAWTTFATLEHNRFKTTPHALDPARPRTWALRTETVGAVLDQLSREYDEILGPFLDATSTPAGLIDWLAHRYQPTMLVTPAVSRPLRQGFDLIDLLPAEDQPAARAALRERLQRKGAD